MVVRNSIFRGLALLAAVLVSAIAPSQPAFAQSSFAGLPTEAGERVELLDRLMTALDLAAADLPRASFDPRAVVEQVGTEPSALFQWVRDNTYFVPYRGVLRGATGVLMDRTGNSLDRALLLRELLRIAGHNALLATGTLTEEQAQVLLSSVRPLPPEGVTAQQPEGASVSIEAIAAQAGLDPETVVEWMASMDQSAAESEAAVRERVEEQLDFLVGAVRDDLSSSDEEAELLRRAALVQNHWWVEIQTDTAIIDLDPTLPDAAIGDLLTQPVTRYSPSSANELRALPDIAHTVVVRVVVERWEEDGLVEEVALEHELFPAELYGQRVALIHVPLGLAGQLDLLDHPDPGNRLAELTADLDEWQPLLLIGDLQVTQKSFTVAGLLKSEPGGNAAAVGGLGGAGGGMFGGFGGAMAGGGDEEQTHVTAEWIEYEIKTPGLGSSVVRRELFDLIGPAARESGDLAAARARVFESSSLPFLTAETEILALPAAPDPVHNAWLTAQAMLANREALLSVAATGDGTSSSGSGAEVTPLPSVLYSLALAADLLDEGAATYYRDSLGIYSFHQISKLTESGFIQLQGFDIVSDGTVEVLGEAVPAERLRRGVALTNAEGTLLSQVAPGESGNTALLLAASPAAGIDWVVVRDESSLAILDLPEDVIARMRADLAAGYLLIAPKTPVPVNGGAPIAAWWRVSSSGEVLGMGEHGWGEGFAEYIKLTNDIATTTACFLTTGLTANKDGALKTSGSLLMCAVGLGLRTGGWISKGKAFDAVGNTISLITTVANVASAVAGAK